MGCESELSKQRRILGNAAQAGADRLCELRIATSLVLSAAHVIVEEPRTWPLAGAEGAKQLTDKLDGFLAGIARVLLRRGPTIAGQRKDEQADKTSEAATETATAIRALRDGENVFAGVTIINFFARLARNRVVQPKRERATRVSALTEVPIKVGAIPQSQLKTGVIAVAETLNKTPIARGTTGRFVVGLLTTYATVLSYASGAKINDGLNESMAAAAQTITDPTLLSEVQTLMQPVPGETALRAVGNFLSWFEGAPNPLVPTPPSPQARPPHH